MTKTLTMIATFSLITACGGEEEETTPTTAKATNWWSVTETGTATGTTGTTSTTSSTATTDYTNGWTMTVVDNAEGTLDLTFDDGISSCKASASVSNLVATKDCADCYSAWLMDIGDVTITLDGGGCDQVNMDAWSNTTHGFGPGAPDIGEYHGLYYTGLWILDAGGTWKLSETGYSGAVEDAGVEYWYLGVK
jgi:hypothetical protein